MLNLCYIPSYLLNGAIICSDCFRNFMKRMSDVRRTSASPHSNDEKRAALADAAWDAFGHA
jgi:hypothetical protein